ncbi:MAG: hypothetical protein EPN20_10955 [Magnetospirillum sp.]|nr:MAG: hypothetical protein EPN20_10955 [Magnetospirillum sp.]
MRGLARLAGVNVAVLLAGLVLVELVFGSWFRGDSLGGISIKTNIDKSLDVHAVYGRVEPVHYSRDRQGSALTVTSVG